MHYTVKYAHAVNHITYRAVYFDVCNTIRSDKAEIIYSFVFFCYFTSILNT